MRKLLIFTVLLTFIASILMASACGQAPMTKTILSKITVTVTRTMSVDIAPVVENALTPPIAVSQDPVVEVSYSNINPKQLTVNPGMVVALYNTEPTEVELCCDGINSIFIPAYGYYYYSSDRLATYGFYLRGNPKVTFVLNIN